MRVYLAGPINGCSDAECKDWRTAAKAGLAGLAECLDPMDRDYRGRELENVASIVENDKADIDSCDVVLVYFIKPSVGTAMEVLYAWQRMKTVIVVNVSGKPPSPWLTYHSQAVFADVSQAIAAIKLVA